VSAGTARTERLKLRLVREDAVSLARTWTHAVEPHDVDERSRRIERRLELPMLVAALLVIPAIVIEQSDVAEPWDTIALVLNWATWLAFLAEAVLMLAVVPDRSRWLRDDPLEVAMCS
jgi:hypothetical protein